MTEVEVEETTQPSAKEPTALTPASSAPPWAVELRREMQAGFERQEQRADTFNDRLGLLEGKQKVLDDADIAANLAAARTTGARLAFAEADLKRHSNAVRGTSENDLRQDATLATLVADVAAVKKNQESAATERANTAAVVREVHSAVSTFFTKHPALAAALVALATAGAVALTNLLSGHGVK